MPDDIDLVLTFSVGRLPSSVKTTAPSMGEPCVRTCNSLSGTANSVKPQCTQTTSFGKTQTVCLFRPSIPGKWIATSPLNTLGLSDWHPLQVMKEQNASVTYAPLTVEGTADTHGCLFKIEHRQESHSMAALGWRRFGKWGSWHEFTRAGQR
jgi:hypothetical protein